MRAIAGRSVMLIASVALIACARTASSPVPSPVSELSTAPLTQLSTELPTTVIPRQGYQSTIEALDVSFVAYDLETQRRYVLDKSDLKTRHAPWSTFKIPNLLIALDTGTAKDLDHKIAWDKIRRPAADYWPQSWRQDQTLRTAFKRSVAWYFQDITAQINNAVYRQYLSDWHYGNANAPDGRDGFWLDRSLQISPEEMVTFIAALTSGDLNVSNDALNKLYSVSKTMSFDGGTVHGKTGSGPVTPNDFDGEFEGWYAGFIRRDAKRPTAFALHVTGPSYDHIRTFRKDFALRLLRDQTLIP